MSSSRLFQKYVGTLPMCHTITGSVTLASMVQSYRKEESPVAYGIVACVITAPVFYLWPITFPVSVIASAFGQSNFINLSIE